MEQVGVPAESAAMLAAAARAVDAERILRSVSLFSRSSRQTIERVAQIAHPRTYHAGQRVFEKGDPSDALLVVTIGRIVVTSLSAEGAEVMLNIINPSEIVGEIGLIDGGARSADATALRDTDTLALMRRDFLPVLDSDPNVARSMLLLLCNRLRQTTAFVEDAVLQTLAARLSNRLQRSPSRTTLSPALPRRLSTSAAIGGRSRSPRTASRRTPT